MGHYHALCSMDKSDMVTILLVVLFCLPVFPLCSTAVFFVSAHAVTEAGTVLPNGEISASAVSVYAGDSGEKIRTYGFILKF